MKFLLFIVLLYKLTFALESKEITLQLSWLNQFQFAGYYMAKEKGFYKDAGLTVNIKPFEFNMDVVKDISEQKIEFGIARETLILDYLNKYDNVEALYALFQKSPLVLLSKTDRKITSIKDFEGKKIMATVDDASQVSINAMLKSQQLNYNSIQYLNHTHNIHDLIEDKADVISAYLSKSPYKLQKMNVDYKVHDPSEYGFDMYSDFLITNNEFSNLHPNIVKSFKSASLRGWEYAFSNINETADMILEQYNSQNLSKEALIFEANVLKKLAYYKNNLLGDINNNKLERIADLYSVLGYLPNIKSQDIKMLNYNTKKFKFTQKELIYLNQNDTFRMCVQSNNYPFEKIELDKFVGITSQYKLLFEKILNKSFSIIPVVSEKMGINYVKEGKCDFISLAMNTSSELLSTHAFLTLPIVLLSKDDEKFFQNFSQLNNKKISISKTTLNYNLLKKIYSKVDFVTVPNSENILQDIRDNKTYGFLTSIPEAIYLLRGEKIGPIHIGGKFNESSSLSFAIRDENKILISIFNKLISNISKDEHDKLISDFSPINYKEVINYDLLFKVVVFSIVLIFFIVREKKLNSKIIKTNNDLKNKIRHEVDLNRKKDAFIFQQSKLASMGEMIANIAHQWRQPLNRINMSMHVISSIIDKSKIKEKKLIEKNILLIENNITYMSSTIDDFSGFFSPKKEMTQFHVKKVINRSLVLFQNKNTDVIINIDIGNDIVIKSYENELIQVIMVLLENAIYNFQTANIKEKTVHLYAGKRKNTLEISILDNGGGIPSEIIDRIFEPYFSTKFKGQGIGVGLYMAKMLVEESMNGKLLVEVRNKNTHFKIQLPRRIDE